MSKELEKYTVAIDTLKRSVEQVLQLHQRRDQLLGLQQQFRKRRTTLSERILDEQDPKAKNDGNFAHQLADLDKEQILTTAQLDALMPRVSAAEDSIHQALPAACPPFQRLWRAIYARTLDLEIECVLDRCEPGKRFALTEPAKLLAESSQAIADLRGLQPPALTYYSGRPLPDDGRPEVVQTILAQVQTLIDNAQSLLTHVNSLGDGFQWPEFDEPQKPEPQLVPLVRPDDLEEESYCRKLCEQAGKDYDRLSDHDLQILSVSLENHRRSRLTSGTAMYVR